MSKLQYSDQEKETSEFVSLIMNIFGYNNKRTKERIEALNILSKAFDIQTKHITHQPEYEKKIVGSLREGIGLFFNSDTDTLQIDHGVVCTENGSTVDGKVTFHIETDGIPQGYCYLKLQHNGHKEAYQRLEHALVRKKNGIYLSSSAYANLNDDMFKYGDGFLSRNVKYLPRNGPSMPRRSAVYRQFKFLLHMLHYVGLSSEVCLKISGIFSGINDVDVVHALPCIQKTISDKWRTRKRLSGWPNQNMVSKAISLPVYVVPVGCKGAQNENLQWRISFVEAEMYLVQSLNDTQRKVLILAKHITKNELKPISKHMKSYLVKMAVLWLAEKVPVAEFQPQHLMARLKDVLYFMKTSIANQVLPHYIVSERNLLECKLQHDHKMLISKLENAIDYINKCVLREMGDKSKAFQMNFNIYASINILNIVLINDVRSKTAEEIAASFIREFKCQSLWSLFFYGFQDKAFPFLYRNLGQIWKHSVFSAYIEAKIVYFMIEEAFSEEQSAIERKHEQTLISPLKRNKTRKKQLSDPFVKMKTNERKESIQEILQKTKNRQSIPDTLAIIILFMQLLTLMYSLQIYQDYESIIHGYIFLFLISFLNKAFKQKAILILLCFCMFSQNYNFYADNFLLMETIFTCGMNLVACGNETCSVEHYELRNRTIESSRIFFSDLWFLIVSQLPDHFGDCLWLAIQDHMGEIVYQMSKISPST